MTIYSILSYKENAMKLSRILHDQPMKPLEWVVFWTKFIRHHKGAEHLQPDFHDLTWYQHHCLDVIGFLLACVATIIFLVTKCCLFCCWKFGKTTKKGVVLFLSLFFFFNNWVGNLDRVHQPLFWIDPFLTPLGSYSFLNLSSQRSKA